MGLNKSGQSKNFPAQQLSLCPKYPREATSGETTMGILEESIGILRDNYSPLSGIPEAQLLRLIRTYELDPGDSVTFNSEQEDCVFVLSGEVAQDNGDEETILDPHNTLSRPVCLASGRITFSARQHSVLGRINPSRLDFLLSWEILRQHKLHAVSLNGGIRDWPYQVEHPA